MELKIPSSKLGGLSPDDLISNPKEKEISDDDDDDRNHKHRRRDTQTQSMERDQMDHALMRSYRKRNKPFENGHPFRDTDSQSHFNMNRDLSLRFEKRRPGANFSRFSSDLNPRLKINQSFSGDPGTGRGRGRDSSSWQPRDSRFSSVDVASQMALPGVVPSAMFAGRGMPNAPNAQSGSWSSFGLIPGIPSGGIDVIRPLGLQGALRTPMNPSLSLGIPQRCRDFEERGFCLRGDMCPMEHGVNRIVVEDVQSLSQFNLPVSLPSAHLLGTSAGTGLVPTVTASSGTLINHKGPHNRINKSGVDDDRSLDGTLSGPLDGGGADVYDPDQPLWNNDCPETSAGLLPVQPSIIDESECLLDAEPADRLARSSGDSVGLHGASSSVWGRIGTSKNRLELKEKSDSRTSSLEYGEGRLKENKMASSGIKGSAILGKQSKAIVSSSKQQNDAGRSARKPFQKAQRTLFVNCIPFRDNRKEALLAHFTKFGEVKDIYIPSNTERAFVQFSSRDEAEAALKAPDAVMGNRFIKMWWANRDSIPDDGSSGNNAHTTPRDVPTLTPPMSVKGKDNLQLTIPKVSVTHASDSPLLAGSDPKAVNASGSKAPPPSQKKLPNLELLEEIRRKQESLELKRKEFSRQLDKLAKQATGVKGEMPTEQAAKRLKTGIGFLATNAGASKPADLVSTDVISPAEASVDDPHIVGKSVPNNSTIDSALSLRSVSLNMEQPMQQLAALDCQSVMFRIDPPLPTGFADVDVLRDHFSSYGELSNVELKEMDAEDDQDGGDECRKAGICFAHIGFTSPSAAEKAFLYGNTWQGKKLQFAWVTSGSYSSSQVERSHPNGVSGAELLPERGVSINNDTSEEEKSSAQKVNSVHDISSHGKANPPPAHRVPSHAEAESDDNSFIPLEENYPENRDSEEVVAEENFEDAEAGKSFESSPTPAPEERVVRG